MTQTIEEKNKAFVLEAFERFSTTGTTQPPSASGRCPTSNIASTSLRAAVVFSGWSRLLPRRCDIRTEQSWPKGIC